MKKLTKEEISDYKEEIRELTELLHTEWSDLKEILSQEIDLEGAYLCGYYEDEDEGEYGAILTGTKEIYQFSVQDGVLQLNRIAKAEDIEDDFPQVLVAVKM